MNRHLRGILLGSTSVTLSFAAASGALAQEVLETVIVTAEKQSSDIQKTAISITAISPDQLKSTGESRLSEMLSYVPALSLNKGAGAGFGTAFVRGIGTTQGASSVPITVNGVASTGAETVANSDVARIEVLRGPQGTLYGRGAFAGQINIITNDPTDKYEGNIYINGGAYNLVESSAVINIPLSDTMAMRFGVNSRQMTGFNHPDGRGADDYEAVRGKFQYKPTDAFKLVLNGSFNNTVNTSTNDSLPQREKAANFASPAFGGLNPCGGNPVLNPFDPWHSPPKYYAAYPCTVPAQLPVNPNPVTGVCQIVARSDNTTFNIGADAEYDFGFADSTLLLDHSHAASPLSSYATNPFLGTIPPNNLGGGVSRAEIAEFRLTSKADDSLKWVTGLFWQQEETHTRNWNRIAVTGVAAPVGASALSHAHKGVNAAFAQVTVPVVSNVRVTGGVRYSEETNSTQAFSWNVGLHRINGNVTNNNFKWDKLTYKAGLDIDITPENLFYASLSTGFRPGTTSGDKFCLGTISLHHYLPGDGSGEVLPSPAGGCVTTAPATVTAVGGTAGETVSTVTVTNAVQQDTIKAYEMGFKNRLLDNKLQLNFSAYKYSFSSLLVSALGTNNINQGQAILQSQVGTKAWGAELEGALLLTPNDRINFGISYEPTEGGVNPVTVYPQCFNYGTATHPTIEVNFNTINRAACAAKNLAANPATVNWVRFRPGTSPTAQLFNAPTWNGSIDYSHVFDLSSGATVTAKVGVHFESSKQTAAAYYYDGMNAAFHKTDFTVTYDTADGKWSMSTWVKNVENHAVISGAQSSNVGTDVPYLVMSAPRTWGVNLSARF